MKKIFFNKTRRMSLISTLRLVRTQEIVTPRCALLNPLLQTGNEVQSA